MSGPSSSNVWAGNSMATDPESYYRQLGQVVAEMPSLDRAMTPDIHRWLGRAAHLVEEGGDMADSTMFRIACDGMAATTRNLSAHQIVTILHRSLARAEAAAPTAMLGAFIPVGADNTFFQALGRVLAEVTKDVLFVDPYLDHKVTEAYVPLVPEGVRIRLLSDSGEARYVASLKPAVVSWNAQFGATRPVTARTTAPRLLHDRLVVLDGARAFALTQSFKDVSGHIRAGRC
jgi:hypothetical protein